MFEFVLTKYIKQNYKSKKLKSLKMADVKFFNKIISRVVSFPVESYERNSKDLMKFFSENNLLQLSILISSRSLYDDLKKDKSDKTLLSLEKYFSRAHFNPIPFGTFSSVGSIDWSDTTSVIKSREMLLKVKFDNYFISKKVNNLNDGEWKGFTYFTNPSIHFLNDEKISFYKSEILSNGSYEIKYVEIDYDENIKWLINRFNEGTEIPEVVEDLLKNDFEELEIFDFLYEIISAGLIINNFIFNPHNYKLDSEINGLSSELISKTVHNLITEEDFKYFIKTYINEQNIFLVDNKDYQYSHAITSFDKQTGQLDSKIQEKIQKYIDFNLQYNNNYTPINDKITEFSNTFYHSFSDGYIPLGKIFNPYSGLKYSSIELKSQKELHPDILKKVLSTTTSSIHIPYTLAFDEQKTKSNLPATFSVFFELLTCKNTGREIVYFKSLGGTSAINLLTRFNNVTEHSCQDIADFEKEIYKDKIIAEVNMISHPRTKNIISDKQYYDYNIPLNTSHSENSNPIFLSDIYAHYDGSNFILASKKHQKEIIPRLTSALNYSLSNSETYKFLCDLQLQNSEFHCVDFNLNHYKNIMLSYVPRVYLGIDILLYPAQILLVNNNFSAKEFKDYLLNITCKFNFSSRVSLSDEKGDIIIDIENEGHLEVLYTKLKTTNHVYVSECVYDSFVPVVTDNTNHYAHEFIASIKNAGYKSIKTIFKVLDDKNSISKNVPILDDWLYFDLYCNSYAENEVINRIYDNIISKTIINQFFFVRYGYLKNHLRVRFKTNLIETKTYIITQINLLKTESIILNYNILTYEQESHRYGGEYLMSLAESIFNIDSRDTITNILKDDLKDDSVFIISILKIKYYLDFFNLSLDEMISFCEYTIIHFSNEFDLNTDLRKMFNKYYSRIKNDINNSTYFNFLNEVDLRIDINENLEKNNEIKMNYISSIIHMSMNRIFNEKQRFNEFKSYYLAKCYFNQLKHTNKT